MAKIKFGMMMTDARGKLGGQVFSKNRAGAYVRTKVTPSNARTVAQQASRAILGSLSIGWNALSETAVKAWNEAVNDWKSTDVFGDLKTPSGKNLYIQLNKNLLQSNQSALVMPPAKTDVPEFEGTGVRIDLTGTIFSFLNLSAVPANTTMQVWATAPLSNGVNYVKNRMRVIGYLPTGAIVATTLFDMYEDKFGELAKGQRIAVMAKYITKSGQTSVPVTFFGVVDKS